GKKKKKRNRRSENPPPNFPPALENLKSERFGYNKKKKKKKRDKEARRRLLRGAKSPTPVCYLLGGGCPAAAAGTDERFSYLWNLGPHAGVCSLKARQHGEMTGLWAHFGRLSRRPRPALCIALLLLAAAAPPRASASASLVQSVSFVYEDVLARPHFDVALGGHDDLVSEAQLQSMLENYVRQAAARRQQEEAGEERSRTASEAKRPSTGELGERRPEKPVDLHHVRKETSEPRASHPESEKAILKEPIVMRAATGQRYVCLLPQPAPAQTEGEDFTDEEKITSNEDAAASESKRREALEAGLSLLDGMEGHCLYLAISLVLPLTSLCATSCTLHRGVQVLGWFTVEYCHNAHIRQYHQPATVSEVHAPAPQDEQTDAPTYNFYLGRHNRLPKSSVKHGMSTSFTGSKALPPEKQGPAAENTSAVGHVTEDTDVRSMDGRLFISLRCHGGTICDKTGKPRTTEVQVWITMRGSFPSWSSPRTCSRAELPAIYPVLLQLASTGTHISSAGTINMQIHHHHPNPETLPGRSVRPPSTAGASEKSNKLEAGTTDASGSVKTGAGTDAKDQHGQHQRAAADAEEDEGKGMHEMKPAVDWKAVSLRRDPLT
ncbi:MAG: hypothetical protein BJ554DRAFT_5802, partial [Olpidium bornovanus]